MTEAQKPNTPAYREGHRRIFGRKSHEEHTTGDNSQAGGSSQPSDGISQEPERLDAPNENGAQVPKATED